MSEEMEEGGPVFSVKSWSMIYDYKIISLFSTLI